MRIQRGYEVIADGLKLIRQRLSDVLHANGVAPFDGEGQGFDPAIHEVMTMIGEIKSREIAESIERGPKQKKIFEQRATLLKTIRENGGQSDA